jgi:hypothetical protein
MDDAPAPARPGDWQLHDADAVRAAAAVLIANSHLETFYPRAWMAGDGLLGNALFYFLSGFGVSLAASTRGLPFGRWIGRRLLRLYPAVIVAGLVIQVWLRHDWRTWSPADAFRVFVFPTTYGYVGHIVLVYAGLYWLLRARSRWPLTATIAAAAIVCGVAAAGIIGRMSPGEPLALGQTGPVMFPAYFTAVALAGGLFGPTTARPRGTLWRDGLLLAGLFAAYVGLKFEMVHGHGARWFPVLLVLVWAMCPLAVRVAADDRLQAATRRVRPVAWGLSLLAAATLEMYIVQFWTQTWPPLLRLRFPLDLAGFWVATVAGALFLRGITAAVMRAFTRRD